MNQPKQTIQEAAATTGWSPRMLRYVEQLGLVCAPRSAAGYRLYGPGELDRLRSLHELIGRHGLDLAQVGFALRLQRDPALAGELDSWFLSRPDGSPVSSGPDLPTGRTDAGEPDEPVGSGHGDWLRFEQDKHQQLLAH